MSLPEVMIVTGGSGGIGAATAMGAARRGYRVCVSYLENADAAEDVVRRIEGMGERAVAIRANLGVEDEVAALFARAEEELGPITALVNNAATLERQMRMEDIAAVRVQRIFAVNFLGSFSLRATSGAAHVEAPRRPRRRHRQRILGCCNHWFARRICRLCRQ